MKSEELYKIAKKGGSLEEMQSLINEGIDLNWKDPFGRTPLLVAAGNNMKDMVDILIQSGADIHCCDDKQKRTVLHYASANGWKDTIRCLVNKKVNLNRKDCHGNTPLLLAAGRGKKETVNLLLRSGADINCVNDAGMSLIHYASEKGWEDIVQCLVDHKVDLNQKDGQGRTPLLMAASNLMMESMVELLIKSGADVQSSVDGKGWTVLHYAAAEGWDDIVQCLVDKEVDVNRMDSVGNTPLMLAAGYCRKDVVDLLIECGADVHGCDNKKKWTVLHYASENGWEDVLHCLVDKDVDLNRKGFNGQTPLLTAAFNGRKGIVDFLIKQGADTSCCDDECIRTVLHIASMRGWKDTVHLLVDKKVVHNQRDSKGNTPLLSAAYCNQKEIVDLLLRSGADVNTCNNGNVSVLHYASKFGWVDTLKSLVKQGGDINAVTCEGDSPLHWAISFKRLNMVKLLLNIGADCNLVNMKGKSPFSMLVWKGDTDLIRECVRFGAYIDSSSKTELRMQPELRNTFYRDVNLFSQAIINKFNRKDLPELFDKAAMKLPPIDQFRIEKDSAAGIEVKKAVKLDIQTKRYRNLLEIQPQPMVLSMMCVNSFIKHQSHVNT